MPDAEASITPPMIAPSNSVARRPSAERTSSALLITSAGVMFALNAWVAHRHPPAAPPSAAVAVPVEQAPTDHAPISEVASPTASSWGTLARIDASTCAQPNSSDGMLHVEQDTFVGDVYVKEGAPTSPTLNFGGWGDHYYDYIRFEMSGRTALAATGQAVLCLYVEQLPANDPQLEIGVVTDNWEETSLSISSRPQHRSAGPFGSIVSGWNAIDVSELVRGWTSGAVANHGIVILPNAIGQTNGAFTSKDSSKDHLSPRIYYRQR